MTIQVLYLEDELDMVQYLPLLLEKEGIQLTATSSITEALDLLKEREFHCVLLDIMMPPTDDMDLEALDYGRKTGIEVAMQIKKLKPKIPLVAFTALSDEAIQTEMRRAGIIKIITRPAEVSQIAHTLREATGTGD